MNASLKLLVAELNGIRLDENLSYAELASEIGIDTGALYKILNGRSDPYDRTIHKIRRALDERKANANKKAAAR